MPPPAAAVAGKVTSLVSVDCSKERATPRSSTTWVLLLWIPILMTATILTIWSVCRVFCQCSLSNIIFAHLSQNEIVKFQVFIMRRLFLSFYISLLPPAGDELHEQTGWKWICGLQQRHVSAATHDPCLSHISFSLWVNPVSWLAACWAGVSLPNIPGSSRSASRATGTSPSATTWRRRRWALAPRPLARRRFSLHAA